MKIIELTPKLPDMSFLLDAIEQDDVLLVRDGHAVVRLEKFDDEDWEDWKYEHSSKGIARGKTARDQYRRGQFRTHTKGQIERGGD